MKSRGNTSLSQDAVRLYKTQDAGYLRVAAAVERNKRQKLEGELHFMNDEGQPDYEDDDNDDESGDADEDIDADDTVSRRQGKKHIVFLDSEEQAEKFSPEEYFQTPKGLLGHTHNRLRRSQLESEGQRRVDAVNEDDDLVQKKLMKGREQKYKELEARMKREEELKLIQRELDEQRERMSKGGAVRGITKTGRKWLVKARKR